MSARPTRRMISSSGHVDVSSQKKVVPHGTAEQWAGLLDVADLASVLIIIVLVERDLVDQDHPVGRHDELLHQRQNG